MRRTAALWLACLILLTIASGSVVTTLRSTGGLARSVHTGLGIVVGVLAFVLGIWCLLDKQPVLRWLGLLAVTATGLEAMTRAVLVHACFAPVLFTAVFAMALFRPAEPPLAMPGQSGLRWLVTAVPPLVFLQIVLGAAHRHQMASVALHMGGAMLVAGLSLVGCVVLLQRCGHGTRLRSLAVAMTCIVLAQVSLGITVFIVRLLDLETTLALAVAAAGHVSGGAFTLAVGTALAIQYQRTVS